MPENWLCKHASVKPPIIWKLKGLQKNYDYIIIHHQICIKVAPSVKLAIVSIMLEEAFLPTKSACFPSSSLRSSRKKAYIVSASSYKLLQKAFHSSCVSNSNGVYKITWVKMVDSYEALCDCYIDNVRFTAS